MMVVKNLAMSVIHHDLILMVSTNESFWLSYWISHVSIATFVLALLSIPSVLMQRRGRPQSALTWVLVLL